ncbi:unnamed protein product [Leptosia nina]|uniref:Acyltransferase 3 domain-containing protein n=1 Tax=Leptosia nina TaxID=320188 RepID=A0AAV1JL74_9NEOP
MKIFIYAILVVSIKAVLGSKIQMNDTLLEWFPPLYDLDEWSSCQHPMDQYCIVDAVLYSNQPSKLLDTLKEYSAETAKHYNRTQIHRGICIPRCPGNSTDVVEAAQSCIDESIRPYHLEAKVISVNWCRTAGTQRASGGARAMGVIVVTLLVITLVATGVSLVDGKQGNKVLLAFSLKKNWELLTSNRLKQESRLKDFKCLDGVKALGIQSVIFTHVVIVSSHSFTDNPDFIERLYDQLPWKVLMNSPLFLQVFFSMTGFITSYFVLIVAEKRTINLAACVFSTISRYIRLAPVTLFALCFTMFWFPLLGSSPHWTWLVEREANSCSQVWWYFPFFGQNFIDTKNYCLGHLWYVGADMHFHIFGMLLLVVLLRFRWLAIPVLSTIFISIGVASGVVAYIYGHMPIITGQPPEVLRTLFADSSVIPHLYIVPWVNPGFFAGLIIGFIHYRNIQKGIKLSEILWFNILFKISLHLTALVAALGVFFLADNSPPLWVGVVYTMFDRTLVSVFLSISILGLVTFLLTALSWRGFDVLGRLTYCAFVIHFIILRFIMANNTTLIHINLFSIVYFQIITTVLTYIVSIPVHLIIELPLIQVWKATVEVPRPSSAEPTTEKGDHTTANGENVA